MNKWQEVSEVVAGLVLRNLLDKKKTSLISPEAVNPATLFPPYNEMIPLIRNGTDIAEVSIRIGPMAVNAALRAAETIGEDSSAVSWVKQLEEIASLAIAGHRIEPLVKKLKNGEKIDDMGILMKAISDLDMGYSQLTSMKDVKPNNAKWIKTGWSVWDKNFGGLPESSLTIVGASPGVGKTTLLLKLAKSIIRLKENKKKQVAIFTLEMTMNQITNRMLELATDLTDDEKSRILLSDGAYSIHEIYATASQAAAQNNLAMIGIDFADLLVQGEQNESIMGEIYRSMSQLAKKTGVPVVLLSQLNRTTYESVGGGIPRINHLRYSGLAEAMAALIILIFNPRSIAIGVSDKSPLVPVQGRAYLIQGKSRYGFIHGEPGALQVDWDGETGWGDTPYGWFKLS